MPSVRQGTHAEIIAGLRGLQMGTTPLDWRGRLQGMVGWLKSKYGELVHGRVRGEDEGGDD